MHVAFVYDVCVVGAGMIGSASARHASISTKGRVILVGPDEPVDYKTADIFGAHYDEARITRSSATDIVWAKLAQKSVKRYRQIEAESGISFYNEVGCLSVGGKDSKYLTSTFQSVQNQGLSANKRANKLDAAKAGSLFPYIKFSTGDEAVWENEESGYINPRLMVQAEMKLAQKYGCDVIRDAVQSVREVTDIRNGGTLMRITTDMGKVFFAKKVLLATGTFTTCRQLLPSGITPACAPSAQTVIFAQVSDNDRERMKNMPSVIVHESNLLEKGEGCYILPPVRYPDGKYYIKLGHGGQLDRLLGNNAEVTAWYRSPPPQHVVHKLKKILHTVFPDFKPASYFTSTCCTCHTLSHLPYIDLISPNLGVAIGGNGHAAKSCDEIGRIGVELLMTGSWNSDLPQSKFKFKAMSATSKL